MFLNTPKATALFSYDSFTNECFRISALTSLAIRISTSAAGVTWRYAKPVLILSLAIAIVIGFKTYQLGESFRQWTDRLVADSQQSKLALIGATFDTPDTSTATVPNVPNVPTPDENSPDELLSYFTQKKASMSTPIAEEAKPRAKRQPKATAKPASEPKQRSKRQSKAKAGDYEDLIAPTHNEQWATKRIPLGTLKPGAIDFDVADPFAD